MNVSDVVETEPVCGSSWLIHPDDRLLHTAALGHTAAARRRRGYGG